MTLAKKYGVVGLLGLMAIVAVNAANVSDFLSGIVTGLGIAMMGFALYKMSVAMKAEKEEKNA
jgi:hypothetical protein